MIQKRMIKNPRLDTCCLSIESFPVFRHFLPGVFKIVNLPASSGLGLFVCEKATFRSGALHCSSRISLHGLL
jgi:hypothetical protein